PARDRCGPPPHSDLHPFPTRRSSDLVRAAASGVDGGLPGAVGRFGLHGGEDLPAKSRVILEAESVVDVTLPGGGGYGPPFERPRSEEHTPELQSRGQLVCRRALGNKN